MAVGSRDSHKTKRPSHFVDIIDYNSAWCFNPCYLGYGEPEENWFWYESDRNRPPKTVGYPEKFSESAYFKKLRGWWAWADEGVENTLSAGITVKKAWFNCLLRGYSSILSCLCLKRCF
jgi:hypothetical protein